MEYQFRNGHTETLLVYEKSVAKFTKFEIEWRKYSTHANRRNAARKERRQWISYKMYFTNPAAAFKACNKSMTWSARICQQDKSNWFVCMCVWFISTFNLLMLHDCVYGAFEAIGIASISFSLACCRYAWLLGCWLALFLCLLNRFWICSAQFDFVWCGIIIGDSGSNNDNDGVTVTSVLRWVFDADFMLLLLWTTYFFFFVNFFSPINSFRPNIFFLLNIRML